MLKSVPLVCFARHFAQSYSVLKNPVPGLLVVQDFIDAQTLAQLASEFDAFDEVARAALSKSPERATPAIMGGGGKSLSASSDLTSANAALKSSHKFISVRIPDATGSLRSGEYFNEYYEPGHQLGYFRNNPNIPAYAWEFGHRLVQFAASAENPSPALRQLLAKDAALTTLNADTTHYNWKLTTNHYSLQPNQTMPHFPFHVDLPANGDMTFLIALRGVARFEIKPVEKTAAAASSRQTVPSKLYNGTGHDVSALSADSSGVNERLYALQVAAGTMIALTEESRWHWMHKVTPLTNHRIAIVFGAREK
eukprot:TRINITY_DN12987_c0_g1_i1.p1 TRINITY_DN12987_c0_g1~~TRINITY_DN12987_c0_g1_i1.p1  ORF type:complete len:309 (+),score=56.32 TRINITY_DN12987_c0_g1_i1:49-975(+)